MTHEAGWAHAPGALRGPSWLREPGDPNALVPHLWSLTAHKNDAGELTVGGLSLPDLVANVNTPAYVLDEADFRARARAFREGFSRLRRLLRRQGVPLHDGRPVGRRGGPQPRRLLRRRADGRAQGRLRPDADRLPRQQQDPRRAAPGGRRGRRADRARLVRRDRAAGPDHRASWARTQPVMVRVTAGVEAHTHEYIATAHEDQKFGLSITSRRRLGGRTPRARPHRDSSCSACTPTSAARSSTPPGFEVAARRVLALHARISRRARRDHARAGPRRRLRHRLHDPGRPERPRAARHRDHQDRRARVQGARDRAAAAVDRARAARSSARRPAPSTPSARSSRSRSTAARSAPTSRSTAG